MEDKRKPNAKQIDPYKELSTIAGNRVTFKSSTPYIPQYVTSNLTASSDPSDIYANRVQGRQLLLENPVRDPRKRKEEEEKRQKIYELKKRKKMGVIGKREAKEKGVWRLDKTQAKYKLFIPLHRLWMSYMSELLGLALPLVEGSAPPSAKSIPPSQTMYPKLVKADFHGAVITVCRSKNPCLVGLTGIVLHETENAFKIITKSNAVKLVPKQNSVFTLAIPLHSTLPSSHKPNAPLPLPGTDETLETVLDIPHVEFELYGNQFRFRSADRAGRKFKHKETVEL
ncbi:RNase P/MRP, p29 subunit [Macrolepiota fuliginosa MF-IS2]|uniref:RNase P/MRP, p29 subunit n=1 Tax=Macrolepiota fuliginosa MF-IS2 TaxID=1400762 RepID=A0A9P5X734_9AGAR|nr:RNase P/MRP, p29 subunit [Macrolepiota fuliginosa MF-IS2]